MVRRGIAVSLIAAVLLTPTLVASPLVDEGPAVAFTFDVLSAKPHVAPFAVRVDALDGRTAASWIEIDTTNGDTFTPAVVQDITGLLYSMRVPWGGWTDGAFDGAGRYHSFSYDSRQDPEIAYVSTWDPASKQWSVLRLTESKDMGWPAAFVVDGVAHVAFPARAISGASEGKVWRHDETSGTWQAVADFPFDAYGPAVAVDSAGHVHMLDWTGWQSTGPLVLKYSVWNGSSWSPPTTPPFEGQWLDGFGLTIDPRTDRAVFAYADDNRRPHIVYRSDDAASWVDEIASAQPLGMKPHVGVSPDGRIHLKTEKFTGNYQTPTGGANVYYMLRETSGTWTQPQPLLPISAQLWSDMVMDENGEPVIGIPSSELQTIVQRTDAVHGTVLARPVGRFTEATLPTTLLSLGPWSLP